MEKLTLKLKELIARPLVRGLVLIVVLLAFGLTALYFVYGRGSRGQGPIDTTAAVQGTKWSENVTITFGEGNFRYQSNSIPNHTLNAEYIMPDNFTSCVPHPVPDCSHIEPVAQAIQPIKVDLQITTRPQKVTETISSPFGAMGVMISGSPVYNPYEGDATTVAMSGNFTLVNAQGQLVVFMDDCSAHPAPHPREQYHYHGLSICITSQVDQEGGPSHIIGYAFDGFPIYGDRDINGEPIDPQTLDECNGLESPTPEFPQGIYHYVMLSVPTVQSTIRCLHGKLELPLPVYQWGLP